MTGAGQYSVAGFQFTAAVVAGVFGGMWLDQKLGTSPWLTIVCIFAGAALGFYSLYRNLMKGQRLGDRRQSNERREGPR
jgi:ATP synthase protein I